MQDEDAAYDAQYRSTCDVNAYENWKATLSRQRHRFTSNMLDFKEFQWAWKLLITRAFGKFVPNTAMVPIAEFLNHANTMNFYCYVRPSEAVDPYDRYSECDQFEDYDDKWIDRERPLYLTFRKLAELHEGVSESLQEQAEKLDNQIFEQLLRKKGQDAAPGICVDCEKEFRIVAAEEIKQGEQVYLSYGKYSNKQLLVCYGFAMPDNVYDYVRLRVPLTELTDSEYLKNRINELGYTAPCIFKLKSHQISSELISAIRSMMWDSSKSPTAFLRPTDTELEINSLYLYNKLIVKTLSMFPTQIKEDTQLLNQETTARFRFAVIYRISLKKILKTQGNLVSTAIGILEKSMLGENISTLIEDEGISQALSDYLLSIELS